jgi:hypothetical protein
MKRAFLLILTPALLAALAFAQTPPASPTTDQTDINGCLSGSDGNYTVMEDNTGHVFRITTSSVDLKPHLGHDVTLSGQGATDANSADAASSFAVTKLNMISEHCAAAAAVPAAAVSTPAETAVPPPATTATAPAATVSTLPETAVTPAADSTPPAETAATPAAAATPPVETAVTPAADATPPAETAAAPTAAATPPAETAVAPAPGAAVPVATVTTPSEPASTPAARHRKRSAAPAVATATPAVSAGPEPVSTPAAAATTPTPSTSSDPASTPAAAATAPAATSRGSSLWLWIVLAVVIIVFGTTFPFLNRWRKRKSLERTGPPPNLSLISEVSPDQRKTVQSESVQSMSDQSKSDQGKSDPPVTRKVA